MTDLRDMDLALLEEHLYPLRDVKTFNLDGTITGRFFNQVILDEYVEIDLTESPVNVRRWQHPIPVKGPETPPSKSKRAKLRAKRKKRK